MQACSEHMQCNSFVTETRLHWVNTWTWDPRSHSAGHNMYAWPTPNSLQNRPHCTSCGIFHSNHQGATEPVHSLCVVNIDRMCAITVRLNCDVKLYHDSDSIQIVTYTNIKISIIDFKRKPGDCMTEGTPRAQPERARSISRFHTQATV